MEWNNFKKQDAGCDKYGKQRLELAIYLRDNILDKYKNNYFIENGTLLGAYRNRQFIPHDDDFDFTFLLNNLEEINDFYNYINENLNKKYKCRLIKTYAHKLEIYDESYGNYNLIGPQYNNNDYHYVTIDIQFYIKKGNYYHCLYDGKTDEDKIEVEPSHKLTGPVGVTLTETPELIVIVVNTVLSHPLEDVRISVQVPAEVYVLPLIIYDPPAHIVWKFVLVDELLIVKFNVAVLSHPAALVPNHVYVPELVYVNPFHA